MQMKSQPAPKHKRRGTCLRLERRKNYERQLAVLTSIYILFLFLVSTLVRSSTMCNKKHCDGMPAASLPDLWEVHVDKAEESTRYFKVVHSEVSQVVSSVVIFGDHMWDGIIHERKLDHLATLLACFPQCINNLSGQPGGRIC